MSNDGKNTLSNLKKSPQVKKIFEELLYLKNDLTTKEAKILYSFALSLIQEYEKDREKKLFIDFAYYIIFKTSCKINDFRAVYDFAVNYGYYPVARKIMELGLIENVSINHILSELSIDDFQEDNKVKTLEQDKIFKETLNDEGKRVSFIAPTSYGKSELIFKDIDKIDANIIGIVVPTKSLIDQVYREAKKLIFDRKIIIHDQGFDKEKDTRILAVVTQERALRLVEQGLVFDALYIDEAHELLSFNFANKQDNRSLLLVRLIRLSRRKNKELKEIYLSPVLNDVNSISIDGKDISSHKISSDLKIMDIYYIDNERVVRQYDRYLGEMIKIENANNISRHSKYILRESKMKNLHYLYRPIFIEQYSEVIYQVLPNAIIPEEIKEVISEIRELVHPDFKLATFLEKGVIYLHSKVPNVIKNYLLKVVRESDFIKHFVANDVVLAGMNLPIDNLFYISGNGNTRDLRNLIGRVNRLNEVFSPDNRDIKKILIPVHFVEISQFPQSHGGKMRGKIEKLRQKLKN